MRPFFRRPILLCLAALAVGSAQASVSATAQAPPSSGSAEASASPVAFVGVTVIPMDGSREVHPGWTVVVRDGAIAQAGPASAVEVPGDATVVPGEGRYLVPGLAEMHAHIPQGQNAAAAVEEIMFLYIANGVTAIRGMLGAPSQFAYREATASGEMLGPTIFLAAPSLNGNTASDPETAAGLVRQHAEAGYDLLKIHPGIPRASWDRFVPVAREVGITFGGHVPADVGIRHALATGISTVDHLDGYVVGAASDEVLARAGAGQPVGQEEILRNIDDRKIAELARLTREAGTWVVPTSYLWYNLNARVNADSIASLPEMLYVSQQQRAAWVRQKEGRGGLSPEGGQLLLEVRRRILKALHDEGVGVLMGTDSPQLFNVPGFALHREIREMAAAGLTPYDVLESGTRNVARYAEEELGADGRFGSIVPGYRADLVLLEENPLQDVANLQSRAGVMVRGRWVPREEIERRLAEIAARYGG